MYPGRPRHLASFSYCGPSRYHLRFGTHERRPLFAHPDTVNLVLECVRRSADTEQFDVLAYCFMPDHVHLLVGGTAPDSDCRRFISKLKQSSGFLCSQQQKTRLWQRYGFERVLREEDETITVARYILENPIRAGLVNRVADYPFLGSLMYSLETLVSDAGNAGQSG